MSYRQSLHTEIEYLKGVGPQRAVVLKKELEIFTLKHLIEYFPFRYVDRTKIYKISEIDSEAAYIQLKGVIRSLEEIGKGKGQRLVAEFEDDSGIIELVWFKGIKWIKKSLKVGYKYLLFGKPSKFKTTYNIVHPELDIVVPGAEEKKPVSFQPVYSTTEKLTSKGLDTKGLAKIQYNCVMSIGDQIREFMPENVIKQFRLYSRKEAYHYIHFPPNTEVLDAVKYRLKFEELFIVQFQLLKHKVKRDYVRRGYRFNKIGEYFNNFYNNVLPFELTGAQKRVIKEIRTDMNSGKQMNRLLQGDVGSGKTMVAFMCILIALDNELQSCLMAPTEILATQHFHTISKFAEPLGLKVRLLTGSTKKAERTEISELLQSGELNILIGTHALIEDAVKFKQLGLAIIDEQHRFGVAQRAKLWKKDDKVVPHVLIMTATPIPRTLAMTFYGDLDNSVIDEMPPGRKEIETRHYYEEARLKVFGSLKKIIAQGRQVYIVYPLIEESSKLDYKNLLEGYDVLSREFPRPEYQIGIVHGKMKAEDKENEMQRFKKGELQILVSTTVIEVGVDVPNATVMVIESAERFGLSQLHQLRGRVGRGDKQSYCILMTSYKLTSDARTRMETMVQTNDGFKIAEVDLNLRGPGDITGTQQSGILNFKLANLATDHQIVQAARMAAQSIIDKDPGLEMPEHQNLKNFLSSHEKEHLYWGEVS